MSEKTVVLGFLYPDLMSTYGDRGNVIVLQKRLSEYGYKVKVIRLSISDSKNDFQKPDFYFFGGGQDQNQGAVSRNLKRGKGEVILEKIESGAVLLSICGGYQLLCKYYQPKTGEKINGLGLFDAYTQASDTRMVGNLIVSPFDGRMGGEIVGFENHSGKTFLGKTAEPLGRVIRGHGNNGDDQTEGAVYKNAIGCYLHGPVLPKNPKFADFLIKKILKYKGWDMKLKKLEDDFENASHKQSLRAALET